MKAALRKEARAAARPERRAKKAKRACMYGPRLANGRCPLKPRTERARAAGIARGVYAAVRPSSKRGGPGDKIVGSIGGALGVAGARLLQQRIKAAGLTGLARIGPAVLLRLAGGAVLAAGLTAYFLTKAIVDNRAAKKASRSEQAFLAAQAYRDARLAAVDLNNGNPLSGRESQALADAFRAQLDSLGLSTSNLKGL